jgi:hypothetical protein
MQILQLLCSRRYCLANIAQLDKNVFTELLPRKDSYLNAYLARIFCDYFLRNFLHYSSISFSRRTRLHGVSSSQWKKKINWWLILRFCAVFRFNRFKMNYKRFLYKDFTTIRVTDIHCLKMDNKYAVLKFTWPFCARPIKSLCKRPGWYVPH